ncbi:MAG: AAA family ATPase [Desulfovibrio sp.]|nr:AAA family ATPase [Desulfovibrio sp.]
MPHVHYAEQNGYYKEMLGFMRSMFGAALKTNPSLRFAVLTGRLRIAKESIFTGLNNLKSYGISDRRFAENIWLHFGRSGCLACVCGHA